MSKYLVQCTYELEIELPDTTEPRFYIEENHCPGTGIIGLALEEHMHKCEELSICWACNLNGKNTILRKINVSE